MHRQPLAKTTGTNERAVVNGHVTSVFGCVLWDLASVHQSYGGAAATNFSLLMINFQRAIKNYNEKIVTNNRKLSTSVKQVHL